MKIEPYVFFNGRCEEAIAFYGEVLGAKVDMMMRFRDMPADPNRPVPPEMADRIMHANLAIGSSQLMMSDGDGREGAHGGFSLSITADDLKTGEHYFDALAKGGQVTMPFQPTFWTPGFGMVTDRFGVSWMINVEHEEHKSK